MTTAFGDPSLVQNDDLIGVYDAGKAMGDDYRGSSLCRRFDIAKDARLGA